MYLYCTDSLLFGPLGSAGGAEGCGVLLEAADKNKHVSESQMSLMSHELTSMIQPYWHSLVLIQQADDHQKQPHRNKLSGRSWRSGVILVLWGVLQVLTESCSAPSVLLHVWQEVSCHHVALSPCPPPTDVTPIKRNINNNNRLIYTGRECLCVWEQVFTAVRVWCESSHADVLLFLLMEAAI